MALKLDWFRGISKPVSILAWASFLTACSTSYKVHHVDYNALDKGTAEPGIYYYLPKTRIVIEAIATGTKREYGALSKSTDNLMGGSINDHEGGTIDTYGELLVYNTEQCDPKGNGNPIALTETQRFENKNSDHNWSISDFTTTTQTLADNNHLYRIEVDPSALSSFSHKISMNEQGIITAATTTVSDGVSPFIFNSIKSLAKLSIAGAGGVGSKKYCATLKDTKDKIAILEKKIADQKSDRMNILQNAKPNVDIKVYELLLAQIDEGITEHKKALADVKSAFGKKTHKETYVIVGELEPEPGKTKLPQWAVYKPKYEKKDDDDTPKRISFLPGKASIVMNRVVHSVEADLTSLITKLAVDIYDPNPMLATPKGVGSTNGTNTQKYGYKVRVPHLRRLRITDAKGLIAAQDIQLAQYGTIVSMPAKSFGSKGTLDLAFNPKTGGLSVITIAADPVSSTAVSQYVDVITETKTAKAAAKKADEAAEKAEAAEAEAKAKAEGREDIDAMLLEIERLQAIKALRALELEIGETSD